MIKRTNKLIKDTLWSMTNAKNGISLGIKYERNFKIETFGISLVFLLAYFLEFSYLEWAIIIFASFSLLGAELFNTAIEESWDKLHPERHESVGKIKDLASGAVMLVGIGAAISGGLVFIHHLF